VRPQENWLRDAETRIGPLIRHASTREQQSIPTNLHKASAEHGIIAIADQRGVLMLGHPYQIATVNPELVASASDTICLPFWKREVFRITIRAGACP
jgi:hypothetical protein